MPFDYNQISEINTGTFDEPLYESVGAIASAANPAIVNANASFPTAPVNWIALTGVGNTVIPGDPVGSILATVQQWATLIYGDTEAGIIRVSSGYLPQDPTSGIRPGLVIELPRVVAPPGASSNSFRR